MRVPGCGGCASPVGRPGRTQVPHPRILPAPGKWGPGAAADNSTRMVTKRQLLQSSVNLRPEHLSHCPSLANAFTASPANTQSPHTLSPQSLRGPPPPACLTPLHNSRPRQIRILAVPDSRSLSLAKPRHFFKRGGGGGTGMSRHLAKTLLHCPLQPQRQSCRPES